QKPSASSSSFPGVRIVTATGSPLTRISSGSSTATRSRSDAPAGSRRTSSPAVAYGGASGMAKSLRCEQFPGARDGHQRFDERSQRVPQGLVGEPPVGVELLVRVPDRDLALDDAGTRRGEHLAELGLRPDGAERAHARSDD